MKEWAAAATAADEDGNNRREENNDYEGGSKNDWKNDEDALFLPIEKTFAYVEPRQKMLPNTGHHLNRLLTGNAEYSTFPKAHGGQPPVIKDSNAILRKAIGGGNNADVVPFTPLRYSKFFKYKLLRYKRRAKRPDHLFFKLCKLLKSQLQQSVNICLQQVNPIANATESTWPKAGEKGDSLK